jgi:hypothetical protein
MSLSPSASLDDVKVRIREAFSNPNVGKVEQVTLKEGPRAFRLATLFEILNPSTRLTHHYYLKIDSIDRRKAGWFYKPEKSISLEGAEPDEIERLFRFLRAHFEGGLVDATEDLHIISSGEYKKLENLLELVPDLASPDLVELIKLIVPRIENAAAYRVDFAEVFERSAPETVEQIALAARFSRHKNAYDRLRNLVDSGETTENLYQNLLEENPWMFGSEYSELLDRRRWTRDDNLDFMLRRTSDNYLEIVEIKTPFTEPLFVHDTSHDSYYPSAKLSRVLGQTMRYIAEIERNRDSILSTDGLDTLKIRARAIVGRDGPAEHSEALRQLNAHLHGIEILTFDQLVRIAGRVLAVFERSKEPELEAAEPSLSNEAPF